MIAGITTLTVKGNEMSMTQSVIRSNSFKVKDIDAFKEWFNNNVYYGHNIKIWLDDGSLVFGGYTEYIGTTPCMIDNDKGWLDEGLSPEETAKEIRKQVADEWNLDEYATEIRKHLADGEEFRVITVSHDKLKFVLAERLIITDTKCETIFIEEGM